MANQPGMLVWGIVFVAVSFRASPSVAIWVKSPDRSSRGGRAIVATFGTSREHAFNTRLRVTPCRTWG
jgi:hypothetical protein